MPGLGEVCVVVNPRSANGEVGRRWESLRRALRAEIGAFESVLTRGPGDATERVREALVRGFHTIVSLGGDGTHNEVVNGFFDGRTQVSPDARLGVLGRGTGSDLIRSLGIPRDPLAAIRVLGEGVARKVDLGLVRFVDHQEREAHRYFVNIASFGIGGDVDDRVNRSTKRFGGFVSFFRASLAAWLHYRNQEVHLRGAEGRTWSGKVVNVAVANGRYFGGGMHIAPRAAMDDGLFDVVILGDLGRREALRVGRWMYRGRHPEHPKVHVFRTRCLEAASGDRVLLDVDGEQPGRIPARFENLPGILPLIQPPPAA